jgi:hypothetical protein
VAEVPKTVKGHDGCQIFLQRCEWHAAEAIKKKLIKTGYNKGERDELVDLIWTWIKAPDLQALESAREKLILRRREGVLSRVLSAKGAFIRPRLYLKIVQPWNPFDAAQREVPRCR